MARLCRGFVGVQCFIFYTVLVAGCTASSDESGAQTEDQAPASVTSGFDDVRSTVADSAEFRWPTAQDSVRVMAEVQAAIDSAAGAATLDVNKDAGSDIDHALSHIRWAWNNTGACSRFLLCITYINDVGVSFSTDGENQSFGVRVGVVRGLRSARSCIEEAKKALQEGNNGLAVMWVMASQIHNPPVKDWLRDHGSAVVAALRQI